MAVLYGISMLAAVPSTSHADDITINGGSSANAGGAVTSGAVLVGAGNSGILNVHAGDSLTLNTTDGSTASRIELGNGGAGTMNIDGGTVTVNIANGASAGTSIGRIWVGGGASGTAGGSGTLNLSSGTLQFLPTVAGTANYGAIAVGRGNGVTGDFNQSGGVTRFASAGAMDIGTEGGTGTYALSGNAVFDAGDGGMTMYVGSRTSGGAGAGTASQGTVHVSDNAQFTLITGSNSGGQLFVGDAGATGTIVQDGAGSMVTIGLANPVQFGGNVGGLDGTDGGGDGSYDLSAGTFNVNKVASSSELVFGAASGGSGTFNLSGGTANIGTDIVLGSVAGSTGTIQQTGGTLSLADGSRIRFGDGTASYALSGGTLKAGGADAIVGNGELDLGNATLQVQGSDFTTSVAATLQGGTNFTVDTAGLGATWSGVLSGSGPLTKAGDGTLLLDAANTYSGTTTIAAGTLALSSTGTLGGGGLVDHGVFDMRGVSTGVNLASLSGDGQVMVGTKALVVGSDNSNSSFSGTIVNQGNGWDASYGTFTKVGTGTLTIDGATIQGGETYIAGGAMAQTSGDTHVSYLSVGTSTTNGTPNVGALNISGGTLTLGTGLQVGDWGGTGTVTQTGGDVVINAGCGDSAHCATLNIGNQGGHGTYAISGGSLSFDSGFFDIGRNSSGNAASDGMLAISGTGAVNVTNGSMVIGNWLAMGAGDIAGTGTVQQTGGTLSIDGNSTLYLSGSGNGTYNLDGGVLRIGGSSLQSNYSHLGGSYAFNLGGGTIQVAGSALSTDVNATLTGGTMSTIDTAGLGATWSGVLSGSGSLTKAGDGTLLLDAANTYSGTTTIAGGTLALSSTGALGTGGLVDHGIFDMRAVSTGVNLASLSGDGQVMVGTKALVVGSDNSDSSFSGTIVDEGNGWDASYGTFTKVGTGTLMIDGATIQGGETYIAGGAMAQTSGDTHVSYLSVGTSTTNGTPNVGALNISGGTLTLGTGLQVGDWGGSGTVTQTGGDVMINAGCGDSAHCASLNIGNQGGHGTYAISGGSLSFDSGFFDIGRNSTGNAASDGLLAISGTGAVNVTNGTMVIGNWLGMSAGDVAGTGRVEQTGGTLSIDGNSTLYLSGSGNGTYNLDGGVLRIGGSSLQANYNNFGGSYTFNLGGGTIQVAGSALSADVNATLKDGTVSTIDTGGLGATWSGVLGGAGALRKAGDGSLMLTAANTYTGGTVVAGGTLNVANAGALGRGAVSLQAGSTLDFADSYVVANAINVSGDPTIHVADGLTETFAGAITDGTASGDMVKTGAGNLVLSAANAYTGETVISEGTLSLVGNGSLATSSRVNDNAMLDLAGAAGGVALNSLAGNGVVNLGTRSLSLTNAADTFSGTIQGSGGLNVFGGHQVLAGVNTYTGDTTVSTGELEVTGSIDQSTVRVQGGVLSGNGSVGGLVTSAGATLAPGGQDIGMLTVNGNLSQTAGSTYAAQIGAVTSDRIVVNGTATIGDGAVLAIQRLPGTLFTPGTRYEVLSASGGINGTYTVTGGDISAFYGIRPSYDSTHVFLDAVQDRAFADAAITRNQGRAAAALDSLPVGNGLNAAVGNLASDAEARKAFDGLSGEIHAAAKTVLMDESEYVRAASTDRLRQAFCAPGGNDASSTRASAVGGDACHPDQTVVWERAFGAWGHTDGSANEARLNQSTNGVLIGADTALSDAWRVGALGGYDQTTFRLDTRGSNGTSDNYSLGAYAGAQWGQLGLRLGTSYTWHDVDTDRSVDFAGYSDRLHAKYNAGTAQVSGELGYAMQAGVVHFEPFAGAAYVSLHTDAADEQGGAAALTARADTMRTAFSTLGFHASSSMALGGVDLTANGSLGWRRAFGTLAQDATQAFAGSQAFDVGSVPVARNAAVLDAGITAQLQKDLTIGVSYTGQFGSGSREQGVRGNLTWSF
jgi:outer membrane autotransporter protein